MTDIENIRTQAMQTLIDTYAEYLVAIEVDPSPDNLAACLLGARRDAVAENIGPISEGVVEMIDEIFGLILPRCSATTRKGIEEIINK